MWVIKQLGIKNNQLYIKLKAAPSKARIIGFSHRLQKRHIVNGIISQPTSINGVYMMFKLDVIKQSRIV